MQKISFVTSEQVFKIAQTYKDSIHGKQFEFYTHLVGSEVLTKNGQLGDDGERWFVHEFGVYQGSSANFCLKIRNFDNTREALVVEPNILSFFVDEENTIDYVEHAKSILQEIGSAYAYQ